MARGGASPDRDPLAGPCCDRGGQPGWLEDVTDDGLLRGQLAIALVALEPVQRMIEQVKARLDAVGQADEGLGRLRAIPGVGPRQAETVVATLDYPHRFKSRREVAADAGLVPRQFESGTMSRRGRITGAGVNGRSKPAEFTCEDEGGGQQFGKKHN